MTDPQDNRASRFLNRSLWLVLGAVLLLATGVGWLYDAQQEKSTGIPITVYKSPLCDCCNAWITHLRDNGFAVTVQQKEDMSAFKKEQGLPSRLASCHTALLGNYLVEGHVPAQDVRRLWKEQPAIRGLALPGMPVGSPGMEIPGEQPEPYRVLSFTQEGVTEVFATH